ncbi:signal peptidase I [Staphylococcus gallinarum]|uniref:signal peptidase I n=1 Tax=Staphylococcus gallinarum TaxID=1293 RepID=UPI001E4B38D6|nr:signal peptidase I [Staphylococcus gallinarum]MCD8793477.1 signal peptidase I [Staphylococcus gallinarum]MCD8871587.1 signal peptidase I [Staphylococcus gallinarum]MCW0986179.1 signal peptidase I [Staphylococcus gallinarum]MDN6414071.1 signal peptidase I [Staphylococcus gallinarum]
MMKNIIEWIVSIAIGVAVAWIVTAFLLTGYTVSGSSMAPTFEDGDKLVVNKLSTRMNTIDRGDVIIFHATKKDDYIKRLIGKPGDTVESKKDKLYINGKLVKEPYLTLNKKNKIEKYLTENFDVSDTKHSGGKKKIPKGKYLVLGDNRFISNDSRKDLGLISKDSVVGKVWFRWLPLSEMKFNFYPKSFDKVNE